MNDRLNSFLFSTPEMTQVFAPEEELRAMMRFEWALTSALEKHGLAPIGSAKILEAMGGAGFVNLDSMQTAARKSGNIAIPFVQQLPAEVKARNEHASRAIRLGATSQDVLDSA